MSDLIDRAKAIFALNEAQIEYDENYKGLGEAKQIINNLPSVKPSEKILTVEIKCTEEEKQKIVDGCIDILNDRLVEELEKIKADLKQRAIPNADYKMGIMTAIDTIDNRIKKMKGNNNE